MGKKAKSEIVLHIIELCDIPFSSGVVFAKWKIKKGGKGEGFTEHVEIQDKRVLWNHSDVIQLEHSGSKRSIDTNDFIIRISIRQEKKGGRSHIRLGVVTVDVTEFLVANSLPRKYLMRDSQLNSTVKILIEFRDESQLVRSPLTITQKSLTEESHTDPSTSASLDNSLISTTPGEIVPRRMSENLRSQILKAEEDVESIFDDVDDQ